jgi:hypothetical protein
MVPMQYRGPGPRLGEMLGRNGYGPTRGRCMKKWLSLIALCCAMAVGFAYAPAARAEALTTGILALKSKQESVAEKARYRCWWHHGYRRCGYYRPYHHGWRHRYWRHRHWRHYHHYGYYDGYRPYRGYYSADGIYHSYRSDAYRSDNVVDGEYRPYRRHYYYNSYRHPTYRPYGYCIGLCWW